MPAIPEFQRTFAVLRAILARYESRLTVVTNKPGNYYLNAGYSEKWKKEVFFGAVIIKKNYVSFYLMALYMCPGLVEDMSVELRARMHGKSCFNFKTIEPALVRELAALTKNCVAMFKKEGLM